MMQDREVDVVRTALTWQAPGVAAAPPRPSRLHDQLLSLATLASPSSETLDDRLAAICRVVGLVRRALGMSAIVQVFGSSCTSLSLPGSDLDVTVSIPMAEGEWVTWEEAHPNPAKVRRTRCGKKFWLRCFLPGNHP